ncbi:AraC family transcriptional regulator [Vibrio sonorensis]|uniref:AraC family transcriptional regulator n=1 Tax=Vibrio sonorensis TaxID=1004316 RepID=UPI0008DA3BEF|nr:AraC family transcriptional regulator [Vibrio sonorensis]
MKTDKTASFKPSAILPQIELRIADNSSACYHAHSHDEFSFGLIDSGVAFYSNGNRKNRIATGDLVTINPADVHSCNPEKGNWSYRMLFVDAVWMGEIQKEVLGDQNLDYVAFDKDYENRADYVAKFNHLFDLLENEKDVLSAESSLFGFVECGVFLNSQRDSQRKVHSPDLTPVREKLLDQMDENHQLDELANEVGLNRYQLLRHFKKRYGLPPHAYLMDEKIKKSKLLLRAGNDISQVAHQLGFADQAHFQRHFKKRIAVTPKYYQSYFVD